MLFFELNKTLKFRKKLAQYILDNFFLGLYACLFLELSIMLGSNYVKKLQYYNILPEANF